MTKFFEIYHQVTGEKLGTAKTLKRAREIQAFYSPVKIRTVDPVVCMYCHQRFTADNPNMGQSSADYHAGCGENKLRADREVGETEARTEV